MNFTRSAFARCAAIVILAVFGAALPQIAIAQNNRVAGTWNFVPDKSTGPEKYKSLTLTITDAGQMTVEGVDAQGKPVKGSYQVVTDGKAHPVTGIADYDSSEWTRITDTAASYIYAKRKTAVVMGNRAVSADGNVLTFRENSLAKGAPPGTSVMVFAKPGYQFASVTRAAPAAGGQMTSPLTPEETAAAAALEKGNDDEAIAMFTKVIEGKPTPMLYYDHVGRGIAYAKKNMNEQAIADFDAALKLKPDDNDARFRRAGTRLQLKQYQPAIDDFSEVVKIDPMNAMAFRLRGFAYNTLGNDKAAGADYDRACMLNKELCQN